MAAALRVTVTHDAQNSQITGAPVDMPRTTNKTQSVRQLSCSTRQSAYKTTNGCYR